MKEYPILFSGPMVRALKSDQKSETRRLDLKWLRVRPGDRVWCRETWRTYTLDDGTNGILFRADGRFVSIEDTATAADRWVEAHENGRHDGKRRPSIFMRRWMCRLELVVGEVRREPVYEIDEAGAIREGMLTLAPNGLLEMGGTRRKLLGMLETATGRKETWESFGRFWNDMGARDRYVAAWCALHGIESWRSNPEVVVIGGMKRITARVAQGE